MTGRGHEDLAFVVICLILIAIGGALFTMGSALSDFGRYWP